MRIKRDKLDELFSLYIRQRANWLCERCHKKPDKRGLHCHHFNRRRKQSTRFDEDNCLSLCLGCHQYFDENRDEEREFMLRKLGQEGFDMLEGRVRIYGKVDREAVKLYLREQIKKLEEVKE